MKETMGTKLLNANQIAKILGVSKAMVYKVMKTGELPRVTIGKAVRVRLSDLEAYINRNIQDPKGVAETGYNGNETSVLYQSNSNMGRPS